MDVRVDLRTLFDSEGRRDLWLKLFGVPEKIPNSLPMNGFPGDEGQTWDDWHREMEAKYPLRHFLGHELPIYWARGKRVFWDDPTYFLVSHLVPWRRYHMVDTRSPANGYSHGWKDTADHILYAMFALLVDFVENEYPGYIDWNADDRTKAIRDEFLTLYTWWKFERPKEHAEQDGKKEAPGGPFERLRRAVFEDILRPVHSFSSRKKGDRGDEGETERYRKREEKLLAKDDEMAKRLIDVRHSLWT